MAVSCLETTILFVNSIFKVIFSLMVFVCAVQYILVWEHVPCSDLRALLGTEENISHFFHSIIHYIISYVSLLANFGQIYLSCGNLITFFRTSEGFRKLPASSIEFAGLVPLTGIFSTWFLALSHEPEGQKCHGINLETEGVWLIKFSNEHYEFIFWITLAFLFIVVTLAGAAIWLGTLSRSDKVAAIALPIYIAITSVLTVGYLGYMGIYSLFSGIIYTFYSKNMYIRIIYSIAFLLSAFNVVYVIIATLIRYLTRLKSSRDNQLLAA
eukprot:TRINITY_DN8819_c0_g2_i1.p1 TRINITY_DN8819_c0_g2~~TRINITY_DN8819_c0_g2_i1.p1  ORF type:complete len:269 (+),score=34.74 TRINITY_DN8819_c0_g2_i1:147-953(+)